MRILVVDDDRAVRESLRRSLSFNGYSVDLAQDGLEALDAIANDRPDALVLDVMMPRLDGLEVCRQLRSTGDDLPILVLTARDSVSERVAGLDAGADDYLPKPFDLDELEARVRALVRRTVQPGPSAQSAPELRQRWQDKPDYCGLRVDGESGAVYYGQQPLELPPRELALLRTLLSKPGHAIAKERLFEQVFPGESEVQYDAIEVVVYRLRKKIAHTPTQIVTLRGLGYLIKAQP